MKTSIQLAIVSIILFTACKKNESGVTKSYEPTTCTGTNSAARENLNGKAGVELVYYDSELFKMNFNEFSEQSAQSLLEHNKSANILYECEGFVTVADAIQGDGYNPVWRVVDIVFNADLHRQFYSDTEILAAAAGKRPEITLVFTDEMYRCDFIQPKKPQ